MPHPNHEWVVQPHGPLDAIDTDLYAVVGEVAMPLVELPRRMTVVRLRDGRLVIWSAIALSDGGMAKLQSIGTPAFLIVPSDHHRLDAAPWKAVFPDLQVVSPSGSAVKTSDVVHVDSTNPDFGDPDVRFVAVPGTRDEEAALLVRRPSGTTLIVNDIIGNIRHASGFSGWLLRRMGLAGDEAQVPTAVGLLIVKDKQALADQLLAWAAIPDLKRIVVSHGDVIDTDPQQTLRDLAQSLTA